MPIEETIYGVLSAAAGVTALVPVDRIKPPGDWQSLTRPYIVYRPITFDPTYTHNYESTEAISHYPNLQINVVADSYSSARAVSDAVKAAIRGTNNGSHSGWTFFLRNVLPLEWDADRNIIEIAQDYEAWGR